MIQCCCDVLPRRVCVCVCECVCDSVLLGFTSVASRDTGTVCVGIHFCGEQRHRHDLMYFCGDHFRRDGPCECVIQFLLDSPVRQNTETSIV